jgi:hypothetical protein
MKLTIVADDGAVGIDGKFFSKLDLSQLDSTIHAVQWYEEHGEVEYKERIENGTPVKPANVLINNVTLYQFAIDAWNAAKTAEDELIKKDKAEALAAQNAIEEPDLQ